jgi:hypothetical protein
MLRLRLRLRRIGVPTGALLIAEITGVAVEDAPVVLDQLAAAWAGIEPQVLSIFGD